MKVLFLHGWQSVPGGVKPTFLNDHGHEVVGSSRGGAVAMNISSGESRLVLLCPAWDKYGSARAVKPDTVILHNRADDEVLQPEVLKAYSSEDAVILAIRTRHDGPWDDTEQRGG